MNAWVLTLKATVHIIIQKVRTSACNRRGAIKFTFTGSIRPTMDKLTFNEATITGNIYKYIFEVLTANPSGVQWKDLDTAVQTKFPDYHPKTINGCIWKLTDKYPAHVHKPEKGRFALLSI